MSSSPAAPVCSGCVCAGDKPSAASLSTLTGAETKIADADCYVVGTGKKAVIFCPDIFGWRLPNLRVIAESYAATGEFTVVIPNYLNDVADPDHMEGFMENFMVWLGRNPIAHDVAVSTAVAQALKADDKYSSVSAVGFCLGAKSSMELAKSKLVSAAVGFHCSFLTAEDAPLLAATGLPLLFNCAAVDDIFTPALRAAFEAELKGKTGTFVEYPGTPHGFGARPQGEQEQAQSLKAHQVTIEFLKQNA